MDTPSPPARRPVVTWWHPALTDYRLPLFERMSVRFDLRLHLLQRSLLDPPAGCSVRYATAPVPAIGSNPLRLWWPDVIALWRSIRGSDAFVSSFSANAITMAGIVAARLCGVRVVVWEEMQRLPQHGSAAALKRRLLAWVARRVDAYFVMGTPQRDLLLTLGVPADRIHMSAEAPALRLADVEPEPVRLPLAGERPVVLFVGRLIPIKGVDVLLRAMVALRRWMPEAALVVAGDGAQRAALEATAAHLGLNDTVFLGHVARPGHKAWLLRRAHVLAVPSVVLGDWAEGGPLVIPEGLSAGTPVVCTSVCGNTVGLVRQAGWGSVVPPDQPIALAEALARWLVRGPDRRAVTRAAAQLPDHDHQARTLARAIEGGADGQRALPRGGTPAT